MLLQFNTAIALRTRLWCPRCLQLRPMSVADKRIWGDWVCQSCGRDRPLRLPRLVPRITGPVVIRRRH